jgi:hypothetical protein
MTRPGYGTKTREWEMDTVAHLEEEKRPETDLSFKLSFPKARERSATNRADFAETIIALVNDQWESKAATDAKGKVDGLALKFLDALRDAVIAGNAKMYGCPAAAIELWKTTCIKKGLIDPKSKDNAMRAMLSKYKLKLIQANHIACNDTLAWLLP